MDFRGNKSSAFRIYSRIICASPASISVTVADRDADVGLIMRSTMGFGSISLEFVLRLLSNRVLLPPISPTLFRIMPFRLPSQSILSLPSRLSIELTSESIE